MRQRLLTIFVGFWAASAAAAPDRELIPPQLSKDQKANLLRFLETHEKPDRFLPAVALARDKSPEVKALYGAGDKAPVRWEYLQLMINKKHEPHEPGDRVVRLVFTAPAAAPVRVVVNLTKGVAVKDER